VRGLELRLHAALSLTQLGEQDFLGGYRAELLRQTHLGKGPDDPLRGIELPGLHPIAVVMLETRGENCGIPHRR